MYPKFTELSFYLPGWELFYRDYWAEERAGILDNEKTRDNSLFADLAKLLNIQIDFEWLLAQFVERDKFEEIYVFHSASIEKAFLLIDSYPDETDQMSMTRLAVRIPFDLRNEGRRIMEAIYFKSTTRSAFWEDAFNRRLSEIGYEEEAEHRAKIWGGEYQKRLELSRHFWPLP